MIPVYKFFLQVGSGTQYAASPIYGNSLALNYEMEQSQRFFRAKLSGKITFVREDYDRIMAAPFGSVFYLTIQKSTDAAGLTFADYYRCKFTITDCTVNLDDKTIVVQPQTTDQYDDILAGLDNEYNLIELAPAMNAVNISRRPLVQVYEAGSDILNCYINNTSWEQECTAVDNKDTLGLTYHFGLMAIFTRVEISVFAFAGTYEGKLTRTSYNASQEHFTGTLRKTDNTTDYTLAVDMLVSTGHYESYSGTIQVNETGGSDNPLFTCAILGTFNTGTYSFVHDDQLFNAPITNTFIFGRWITDAASVSGITLYDIPADDMAGENRNYHKCAMIALDSCFRSILTSSTPTQYGLANSAGTLYYLPPNLSSGYQYKPIAQSAWTGTSSFWFAYHATLQYLENLGRKQYLLRNAYPVWGCISALLSQFSTVTFAGTSTYSQFLYGSSNPIYPTEQAKLFVTPKSNILNGDYTTPAQKAVTTLGKFLDMLRNVYQLYWFVDASNRLRIEHIKWFKNGGSYSSTPAIGTDLTDMWVKRNDTAWAYGVNEYTYEKQDMPQRYQFAWMDDATIPFKGGAIEILSPAVTEGKVENISIGDFSSDIDYMMLNSSVFSQDGFALFAANGSGNSWTIPFVTYTENGVSYTLQNGYLAMVMLQPNYWTYDLPSKSVKINGTTYTLSWVSRRKMQKVLIPLEGSDPDLLKLVKTGLGNGELSALSVNLTSRVAETTLKYDTE